MWSERMRDEWQRTAFIVGHLIAVNSTNKNKIPSIDELNPMERKSREGRTSFELKTEEGFQALKAVANQWRPGR